MVVCLYLYYVHCTEFSLSLILAKSPAGKKPEKIFSGGKGGRGPPIFDKDCFKKGARDLPPPNLVPRGFLSPILRRLAPSCAVLRRFAPSCAVLRRFAPFCAVLRRFTPFCAVLRRLAPFCAGTALRRFAHLAILQV